MAEENPSSWIGRQVSHSDEMHPRAAQALHLTLDRTGPLPENGTLLPLAWHWVYFTEAVPFCELGRDGHPAKGAFLPPIVLPRRMWAGGKITVERPLILGEPAKRISTIISITQKEGRSGALCFVKIEHNFEQADRHCFTEQQDIVYREDPAPGRPSPPAARAPETFDWQRKIMPDPVMLFRYSALTFNGHRIHYDRDYACDVEGYKGLVVHGPLIATWLLELLRDNIPDAPRSIRYQASAPLFDHEPLLVRGRKDGDDTKLWAAGPDGRLIMHASALTPE